jgi:hypothetical protein
MIEHELISQGEINRKQAERKTANRVANEQHSELRHVTQGAARRKPKPDRWFRRVPRAVRRGARSARRYLERTAEAPTTAKPLAGWISAGQSAV